MKCLRGIVALLALLPGTAAADEGRTAIFQSGTIDRPGSYVLNRDIVVDGGDAIVIRASQVDLDLNGYAIRSTGSGTLILIADGFSSIRIRNGRLLGNDAVVAIAYGSSEQVPPITLRLEDLEIDHSLIGVFVWSAAILDIVSCDIVKCADSCVLLVSAVEAIGRIVDSRFAEAQYNGLHLVQGGMELRGNIVSTAPQSYQRDQRVGARIIGHGGILDGNLVASIDQPPDRTAGIELIASGVLMTNNVLDRHSTGVIVHSNGNRIAGNVIRRSGFNGVDDGNGIDVSNAPGDPAAGNLIEVNMIEESLRCALNFSPFSADNAYRGNMRFSSGVAPVCDGGNGNTDAGGNL